MHDNPSSPMGTDVARNCSLEAATFVRGLATESTDPSLYHGTAGVLLFELELAELSGDPADVAPIVAAGHELVERLQAKTWASVSFATGWPGYAFVLQTLFERTGVVDFQTAAAHCLDRLIGQATSFPVASGPTDSSVPTDSTGLGWVEPMPFSDITGKTGEREIFDLASGAAGAGLALLHAHRGGIHTRALEWAIAVADRLLDVAEVTDDGLRWGLMSDMPFPFTAPNFAHGGAGVGYFMAQVFDATGEERFLSAAVSAAQYVMTRRVPLADGACLVCHTEEQQPPIFYLGECHGPTGTWRLLTTLGRLTGDARWAEYSLSLLGGLRAIGAPATRSAGWWQNYSQCCGDAGMGDTALAMWAATGDDRYYELASDCVETVLGASTVQDGGRSWEQAEHRARPKFVQRQTGYMQGAAGIGSFLLHYATARTSQPVRILFPDERL
jgi:lantibiotic modifying enzyme